MMNYIWAGLIAFSLVFALIGDITDLRHDPYRNGQDLAVAVRFKEPYRDEAKTQEVDVAIDPAVYTKLYGVDGKLAASYAGTLVRTGQKRQLRFAKDAALPEPLATIRQASLANDSQPVELRAGVTQLDATAGTAAIRFEPVRFLKMNAISAAAIDLAKKAVTIALEFIGVFALWMGILKIAEASGLVAIFVRLIRPILKPLFPEIPNDHPALGMISLNLAANMLGLGNAATPMGLKAMEEMQTVNPKKDTATNPMVMFLVINTAGVQLVPPVTVVALMGLGVNEVYVPILICTALSLIVAIIAAKTLSYLPGNRATDPNRAGAEVEETVGV
jgi:spore maturation protein A